jgi:16S rRNA (cytidine1402-2'-O)-methyltransferase
MGTLYLVGTPIGNLEDISPRALDVLRRVSAIASENPARTQRLLAHYHISTPMMRFTDAYDRKKEQRIQAVLDAVAEGDIALVSEAGLPGLADPGHELISVTLAASVPLEAVPGPTAVSAALSVSGFRAVPFLFLGFLPRGLGARHQLLAPLVARPWTLVAYESPHRLISTVEILDDLFGTRTMALVSELTKLYERVRRGTARTLLEDLGQEKPRGEFTLVISPPS